MKCLPLTVYLDWIVKVNTYQTNDKANRDTDNKLEHWRMRF